HPPGHHPAARGGCPENALELVEIRRGHVVRVERCSGGRTDVDRMVRGDVEVRGIRTGLWDEPRPGSGGGCLLPLFLLVLLPGAVAEQPAPEGDGLHALEDEAARRREIAVWSGAAGHHRVLPA